MVRADVRTRSISTTSSTPRAPMDPSYVARGRHANVGALFADVTLFHASTEVARSERDSRCPRDVSRAPSRARAMRGAHGRDSRERSGTETGPRLRALLEHRLEC